MVIFHVQSWKMQKKIANFFFWQPPEFILINIFSPTFVPNLVTLAWKIFGDFSLKNESRNAKRSWLIKWSIMHIFDMAEPP